MKPAYVLSVLVGCFTAGLLVGIMLFRVVAMWYLRRILYRGLSKIRF